jgi:hypothetical protein
VLGRGAVGPYRSDRHDDINIEKTIARSWFLTGNCCRQVLSRKPSSSTCELRSCDLRNGELEAAVRHRGRASAQVQHSSDQNRGRRPTRRGPDSRPTRPSSPYRATGQLGYGAEEVRDARYLILEVETEIAIRILKQIMLLTEIGYST